MILKTGSESWANFFDTTFSSLLRNRVENRLISDTHTLKGVGGVECWNCLGNSPKLAGEMLENREILISQMILRTLKICSPEIFISNNLLQIKKNLVRKKRFFLLLPAQFTYLVVEKSICLSSLSHIPKFLVFKNWGNARQIAILLKIKFRLFSSFCELSQFAILEYFSKILRFHSSEF